MPKPKKEYRLHTYGILETEDYYFMSESRALEYAEKWIDKGRVKGYKIYDPSGKLLHKVGSFRCLDWDKVNEHYASIDQEKKDSADISITKKERNTK